MIPRRNRFHGLGSLNHVYKHGQTVRGPIFALKYLPNTKKPEFRLAVVVSKKVHKSAVRRNQIRRRVYESVRHTGISQPFDIIITIFSDKILDINSEQLTKMLLAQLRQADIAVKTQP